MTDAATSTSDEFPCPLDPWLLAKLVCPVTRTPLRWDGARGALVSDAAGLAYPVRDDVPVLLAREAVRLQDAVNRS